MRTSESMINQLPYELSRGVTATEEGLHVANDRNWLFHCCIFGGWAENYVQDGNLFSWPDVAERLRYREGEPWCKTSDHNPYIMCELSTGIPTINQPTLHRLAAILCNDAEAFRVLHECIEKYGD